MWRFKSLKGKDKWLLLLTIGIIFCILAFPTDRLNRKESADRASQPDIRLDDEGEKNGGQQAGSGGFEEAVPAGAKAGDSYEAEMERRVREILKHVEGVGEVDVMIVLKSSAERVVHTDGSSSCSITEEQDSNGGTRKIKSQEQEQNTVMVSGSGESAPMIAKELYPEISGIIISAEGGGAPGVQAEISAAMEALFGLPAHKIKVLKRVE